MEEDMEITPADEQPRAMVSGYGHDTRKEKVQDPISRKKKKGLKRLGQVLRQRQPQDQGLAS
jgi:hypothetical protein